MSQIQGQNSKFTAVPTSLWNWEPFYSLTALGKVVWMALYTSAETKRIVPGLFHGGIATFAEASRMSTNDAMTGIEELLGADLIEFDPKNRIIRLTEFPDTSERPANGDHIKGWWNRFRTVPICPVRDAHVRTLRVLVEGTSLTTGIEAAWESTFGQIKVPAPRRRGLRSLGDTLANNETSIQQSLFVPPPRSSAPSDVVSSDSNQSELPEPLSSAISGKSNDLNDSGHGVPHPTTHRQGKEKEKENVDLLIPDSGRGGSGEGMVYAQRPHLALVPDPEVVTLEDLLSAATGRPAQIVMPDVEATLRHAVAAAQHRGITRDDMQYIALARNDKPPCGPEEAKQVMRWFSEVQNIADAITAGKRIRADQDAMAAEWKRIRDDYTGKTNTS